MLLRSQLCTNTSWLVMFHWREHTHFFIHLNLVYLFSNLFSNIFASSLNSMPSIIHKNFFFLHHLGSKYLHERHENLSIWIASCNKYSLYLSSQTIRLVNECNICVLIFILWHILSLSLPYWVNHKWGFNFLLFVVFRSFFSISHNIPIFFSWTICEFCF